MCAAPEAGIVQATAVGRLRGAWRLLGLIGAPCPAREIPEPGDDRERQDRCDGEAAPRLLPPSAIRREEPEIGARRTAPAPLTRSLPTHEIERDPGRGKHELDGERERDDASEEVE